jgi:hypothetical protein
MIHAKPAGKGRNPHTGKTEMNLLPGYPLIILDQMVAGIKSMWATSGRGLPE